MVGSLYIVLWYLYQLIRDIIDCCSSAGDEHILTTLDSRFTPEDERKDNIIRNKQIVDYHVKHIRSLLSK